MSKRVIREESRNSTIQKREKEEEREWKKEKGMVLKEM